MNDTCIHNEAKQNIDKILLEEVFYSFIQVYLNQL